MRALLLSLCLSLSSGAVARTEEAGLLGRLNSVRPGAATAADCDRHVAQAAKLNGPDLLYAASVCYAANKPGEGTFLLNAGQVRSTADLVLTVPAAKADSDIQTSLYQILYFHAGGPGKAEVLRDATLRDRAFSLFDGWSPSYGPDYDPGWKMRRRPDAAVYQAAIAEQKAARQKQLGEIARLYSDEEYHSLHRQFQDLQARNGSGFAEGTADAKRAHDLMRLMSERSAALGIGPHPGDEDSDPGSEPFPPASPAREETVLAGSTDSVAKRCSEMAERFTIASESKILRVLITNSPEWGVVWRADMAAPGEPAERFTCTANTSASRPLDMGDERIPPLP